MGKKQKEKKMRNLGHLVRPLVTFQHLTRWFQKRSLLTFIVTGNTSNARYSLKLDDNLHIEHFGPS